MPRPKTYIVAPGDPVCGPRRGTYAGTIAHRKARQAACPECLAAEAKHRRDQRRAKGQVTNTLVPDATLAELLWQAPQELRQRVIRELRLTWLEDTEVDTDA